MFPTRVETDHLDLRRFDEAVDPRGAYEFFGRGEPDVVALERTARRPHDTPKETFDRLETAREEWKSAERALYALFPKEGTDVDGGLVGTATLTPDWERRKATFGARLLRPHCGQGYAAERGAASLVVTFEHLDLEVASPGHVAGDDRSKRAVESYIDRFGGEKDGVLRRRAVHGGEVADLHLYAVTREAYEANRPDDLDVVIHDG